MKQKIKPYVVSVAISLGTGLISALLTKDNMDIYKEIVTPPLSPPAFLFPVVWSVLYVPCPYSFYERVKLEVAAFGGIIRKTEFTSEVELEILVAEQQAQPFFERLTDMSAATIEGMEIGKEYRAFPIEEQGEMA